MGSDKLVALNEESLRNKIYNIRGKQVILDNDLANFYEVSVKVLNQAVKRNVERFPREFMFQLDESELIILRSQIVTTNVNWSKKRFLPYVFTEQGVAMLSGVLRSDTAIKVSIQIINAFVSMRKFLFRNAEIFMRLDNIEKKQFYQENKFELVFKALETYKPKQGVFFNGQIFDPYELVSKLIKDAKKNIVLIDNYIDETVLTLFSKREKEVNVIIYTKEITEQLRLDLKKFNLQYDPIKIKEFNKSHDRFLIIDGQVYHFGASLKDLGKKWFAFSKFDKDSLKILNKLKEMN